MSKKCEKVYIKIEKEICMHIRTFMTLANGILGQR